MEVAKVEPVRVNLRENPEPAPTTVRSAIFEDGKVYETPIHDRSALSDGHTLQGPIIVEQFDTTTVVPPDWHVSVDAYANLVIEPKE